MTIIYFIIAIGILVLVHELGHFIMAIRNKVRVEQFSIGFGPKLIGFKRGETEYRIAPIPLGGYVHMTGEDPKEQGGAPDDKSFAQKSVWTRIKIVGAGPVTNILFAFIVMPIVFIIGRMEPAYLSQSPVVIGIVQNSPAAKAGIEIGDKIEAINDKSVATWDELQRTVIINVGQNLKIDFSRNGQKFEKQILVEKMPDLKAGFIGIEPMLVASEARIGKVLPGGPSEAAGLKSGDRVVSIDGHEINNWIEMSEIVNDVGAKKIKINVDRNGTNLTFDIQPAFNKDMNRWMLGILKDMKSAGMETVKRKYGFIDAVKKGFDECVNLISLTMIVLKKLVTLQLSYKSLGGPVQIAQASAVAAEYGLGGFIYFLGFLSIQLGLLNLLPIPILDGGQILFTAIEGVIRRPLPMKLKIWLQYIGLVFLLAFFLLITVNDIDSVWGIKKIFGKFIK